MSLDGSQSMIPFEPAARAQPARCLVDIGTCGYSYPEWSEAGFYPRGIRQLDMLPAYMERFPITELNHTWYQMPRPEAIERQRLRAHDDFLFAVKLTRTMTHEVEAERWRDEVAAFRRGIAPLVESAQLAAVLAQLPQRFGRTTANRRHLAALLDALEGLPVAVEFRNSAWATDRVFAELEARQVTLVTVDGPQLPRLFPSLDVVTNPELIYVRLHGRNGEAWYSGSKERQFDYDYGEHELLRWIEERLEPMAQRAARGFVFFNNHVAAQAPRNAEALARLLRGRRFRVRRGFGPVRGRPLTLTAPR